MKCTVCKIDQEDDNFSWRSRKKNIRHKRCKSCISQSVKKHYLNNKDKYKKKAKVNNETYAERNRRFIYDYLKLNPCIDCGESDVVVLDFDHVRGTKSGNISRMKEDSLSLKTIQKEIEKCEVRCANCHRRKTARQNNHYTLVMQLGDITHSK